MRLPGTPAGTEWMNQGGEEGEEGGCQRSILDGSEAPELSH